MSDVRITAGLHSFLARLERALAPRTRVRFEAMLPYLEGLDQLRPLGELALWHGAQDILFQRA